MIKNYNLSLSVHYIGVVRDSSIGLFVCVNVHACVCNKAKVQERYRVRLPIVVAFGGRPAICAKVCFLHQLQCTSGVGLY